MSSIEDRAKEILKEEIAALIRLQDDHLRIIVGKKKIVENMARKLEDAGMDPDKVCVTIKHILKDNDIEISEDTIEKACGIEQKRKHKMYEPFTKRENPQKSDFQQPVTVSSDGSESYTRPDGSEGERENEQPEKMSNLFTGEISERSTEIALANNQQLIKEKEDLKIRLNEAFKLIENKEKEIERQRLLLGELEIRVSDIARGKSKVVATNVDQIEELQIELDTAKQRIQELEELERFRIQKEDFKTASKVASPSKVWVAAINALNLYRGLNEASKYAIEHNDPWKKVLFDVTDNGQLKNARLEQVA